MDWIALNGLNGVVAIHLMRFKPFVPTIRALPEMLNRADHHSAGQRLRGWHWRVLPAAAQWFEFVSFTSSNGIQTMRASRHFRKPAPDRHRG